MLTIIVCSFLVFLNEIKEKLKKSAKDYVCGKFTQTRTHCNRVDLRLTF